MTLVASFIGLVWEFFQGLFLFLFNLFRGDGVLTDTIEF